MIKLSDWNSRGVILVNIDDIVSVKSPASPGGYSPMAYVKVRGETQDFAVCENPTDIYAAIHRARALRTGE
ncbi:hypothetical protein FDI24_gp171 [Acidovorax phage ACP17]|uniref:Uncharacterized protein n=1 Tax=Acidovorax phage ACP17 TaxID=2010329 RepID=A0A218M331_9CAUD|nr:hypothetical protein FDI24_gp171 [Acidovorax phage ACP17]ASD50453.1 hypothetical protein [Acidovorax phage ACP17]